VSSVIAVYRVTPSTRGAGRWYVPDPGATSGRQDHVAAIGVLPEEVPGAGEAYLVDERLQWDDGAGEVTQLSFVRRAAGLDRDVFARHWSEIHAPLARVHHPKVVRYAQHVVMDALTPGAPEVDGIAELTFTTLEDCRSNRYDTPEGQRIISEDVARFLNIGAGWRTVARLI
jgi:uncharacterized protein (TIGR02118 family)